jgi:hypothetical protein
LTSILVIACAISIPMEGVMPRINSGKDHPFVFHAFPLRFYWIPFFLVPLSRALLVLFRNIKIPGKFGALFVFTMVAIKFLGPVYVISNSELTIWAISLISSSWIILVLVSWYVYRKLSLVRSLG